MRSIEMESVTHIAGPKITACGRIVQRCSLCGEKLCDSNRTAMASEPGRPAPEFPTWEVGRLVRITSGNPTAYQLLDDSNKLPEDSCIDLIEQ